MLDKMAVVVTDGQAEPGSAQTQSRSIQSGTVITPCGVAREGDREPVPVKDGYSPEQTGSAQTAQEFAIDLARELYDRFVMGGWVPQDSHAFIESAAEAYAQQQLKTARVHISCLQKFGELAEERAEKAEAQVAVLQVKFSELMAIGVYKVITGKSDQGRWENKWRGLAGEMAEALRRTKNRIHRAYDDPKTLREICDAADKDCGAVLKKYNDYTKGAK